MTEQQHHTRTLTLVVQAVVAGDAPVAKRMAVALLDYALDVINGTGGNSQFERHVTANDCRIECIASIAPVPGDEAREYLTPGTGEAALRDRLVLARQMVDYLPGGESCNELSAALGYTPEKAASELRDKLDEALEGLGIEREGVE